MCTPNCKYKIVEADHSPYELSIFVSGIRAVVKENNAIEFPEAVSFSPAELQFIVEEAEAFIEWKKERQDVI